MSQKLPPCTAWIATVSLVVLARPVSAESLQPEPVRPELLQPSPLAAEQTESPPGTDDQSGSNSGDQNHQKRPLAQEESASRVGKIGRVHDNIRRDRRRRSFFLEAKELYGDYARFKDRLEREIGLSWTVDISYLQQWAWQDGGSPAGQFLVTPNIHLRLFRSKALGEGSLQVSYTAVRYPTRQSAADLSANIGVITPINDYPAYQNIFEQLSYTHSFPGDKFLLTVGQYPFNSFDGNFYLADQQENFNSYILAQNGSSTYPEAGLGAYAQLNITKEIQLAAGFQNPNDLTGSTLSTVNSGAGLAWFAYAQWTPKFSGLGSAQYSLTYYQVPAVPEQGRSTGWSFNAMQNLNETWAIFGRANAAYQATTPIRSSFALGAAMNDPLGRNKLDQIGVAIGYSAGASTPTSPTNSRSEKIVEAYWSWAFTGGLLLTPSVQYIIDPALAPTRDSAWAMSLRATLMF